MRVVLDTNTLVSGVTNTRLERRIQEIEKLDARKKRQIMQFLNTFIDNEKLKQKVEKQAA